jgi:MFS family permease
MSHFASLIGPLLAAWLMRRSLRLSFELVLVLWVLTFISVAFLRETLVSARDTRTLTTFAHRSFSIPRFTKSSLRRLKQFRNEALSGLTTRNLKVCLLIFCLNRLAFTSESFVFQYAWKILDWNLEKTSWIQFTHSLAAIATTAVLLPSVNALFQKRTDDRSTIVDVTAARGSLLVAVLGCVLLWQAQSSTVMILGTQL